MTNKIHLVFILIIVSAVFLVYYDSFNNDFVYDDFPFLVENPAIKNLNIEKVISYFTDKDTVSSSKNLAKDVWRPLMTLSFALDYKMWKLSPRFYHIENTLLHAVNAVLVYMMIFLILGDSLAALIGALVFALHPIQTGAVTWVSGRSNVLFLLFFLTALITHIKDAQAPGKAAYYCASLVLFTLSLLSKEMAIILPAVFILYDLYFHPGKTIKEYVSYYLPFFLIAGSYLAARFSVLGVIAQQTDWWGGSIFTNMVMTIKAVAGYVWILIVPVNLRAEYFIDAPKVLGGRDVMTAVSIILLAAILCRILRGKKSISFWALWFVITLIPVCNIVPLRAVMAERFLYLPLIGFAAIVGIIFSNADRSAGMNGVVKSSIVYGILALIVLYGAVSISRNIEWRDEMSFYACEALRSPKAAKARYNLGYVYAKKADELAAIDRNEAGLYYSASIFEFGRAAVLKPDLDIAYFGLGNTYNTVGLYDLAIKNFRKSAALKESADVYNNMALAYYRKKMGDEAITALRNALRIDPRNLNAWVNLGNAYIMKGLPEKAAAARKVAARLERGAL